MNLTLKEEMAMAILRGDDAAAYALADLLIEEKNDGHNKLIQAAVALRESTTNAFSQNVYQ